MWIHYQNAEEPKDNGILAYYVFGADTATTALGVPSLLDTLYPEYLSGVIVESPKFPKIHQGDVRTLATFYYSGKEGRKN